MDVSSTSSTWDPLFGERSEAFRIFDHLWEAPQEQVGWPGLRLLNRGLELAGGCQSGSGAPIRFVEQAPKSKRFEDVYDVKIFERGEVNTRPNWHDFFNAMTWGSFPRSKVALNARHYEAMGAYRECWSEQRRRSDEEHLMCLMNENAVLLPCASAEVADLVRGFQWKELFWERRQTLPGSLGVFVLGHALCEKFLTPYVGMTGHGILMPVAASFFGLPLREQLRQVDERFAQLLRTPGGLQTPQDLCPFPILGYPGLSPWSEDPAFFENQWYFRPGRRSAGQPVMAKQRVHRGSPASEA